MNKLRNVIQSEWCQRTTAVYSPRAISTAWATGRSWRTVTGTSTASGGTARCTRPPWSARETWSLPTSTGDVSSGTWRPTARIFKVKMLNPGQAFWLILLFWDFGIGLACNPQVLPVSSRCLLYTSDAADE